MVRTTIFRIVGLLGIGGLAACGGMGLDSGQDAFVTAETPISSAHPVEGLDDEHN